MTASEYYIDWERKGKKRPKQHITSEKSICILKELLPDELEIITLRNFEKMSFDLISIHVGYANHSSIIRKYRKIIDKVRKMNDE